MPRLRSTRGARDPNADRPHQSLAMAFPAARFAPATGQVLGLRVPASLAPAGPAGPVIRTAGTGEPLVAAEAGGTPSCAVELDRVVPPSGNLQVAGQQISARSRDDRAPDQALG